MRIKSEFGGILDMRPSAAGSALDPFPIEYIQCVSVLQKLNSFLFLKSITSSVKVILMYTQLRF